MNIQGLPQRKWQPLFDKGITARTWISADLVLQQRPAERLPRWRMGQKVGQVSEGEPLLEGARSLVVQESSDWFWVLQRRFLGESWLAREEDWRESWERVSPEIEWVVAALRRLRSLPWSGEDLGVESPSIRSYRIKSEEVLRLASDFLPEELLRDLPQEHQGPEVLSHGDPIIKNLVFAPWPILVDWENVAMLPQSADPLHFLSYAIKYAPPDMWSSVVLRCQEAGIRELAGGYWKAEVLWGLLREFIAHPSSAADRERWRQGLGLLREEFAL